MLLKMNTIKSGGGRDQGWVYLSFSYVNFKENCCHSCVICDCIEKMKSKVFSFFFALPFFFFFSFFIFDVFCRYFYCKMNVMFLSDTNLV